jgi:very-short-patch-repair endonuclease
MTLPERLLWHEMRGRRLGPRFRRQVPIDRYVVDFYCPEAKVVIEVDGWCHRERHGKDDSRTAWLETRGYRVIRLQAIEILTDLDAVRERLLIEISATGPTSPGGGGATPTGP